MTVPDLRTDRLLLRRWREQDRKPFAEMNADPGVMERLGMRHLTAYDHPVEGGPDLPSVCYLLRRGHDVPWEAR